MPGPISDSYEGPTDDKPILPRWAFPADPPKPPEPYYVVVSTASNGFDCVEGNFTSRYLAEQCRKQAERKVGRARIETYWQE